MVARTRPAPCVLVQATDLGRCGQLRGGGPRTLVPLRGDLLDHLANCRPVLRTDLHRTEEENEDTTVHLVGHSVLDEIEHLQIETLHSEPSDIFVLRAPRTSEGTLTQRTEMDGTLANVHTFNRRNSWHLHPT